MIDPIQRVSDGCFRRMMNDGSPVRLPDLVGIYPNDGGAKPGYPVGGRDFDRDSFTPGRWPAASPAFSKHAPSGRCAVRQSCRGRLVLPLWFAIHAGVAFGQVSGPLPEPFFPVRIEICESTKVGILKYHHCGTFTWNGQNYDVAFLPLIGPGEVPVDTGAVGTATMQRAGNSVTFSRVDSEGTEGTSTYQGTVVGNTASGTATWFHPNLPNIKGSWTATFIMAPALPPMPVTSGQPIGERIEVCEQPVPNPFNLRNCGILTWRDGRYDAAWSGVWNGTSPQTPPGTGTVACERDGNRVTLNRVDVTGIPGITAVYHGVLAVDNTASGSVIWYMNGTVFAAGTWKATPKGP